MIEPEVIYEDKNFIAVNKPAGLLVHPTATSKERTLVDWLLDRYPEIWDVGDDTAMRPGIVHRLDKTASGIMLVPRNQEYFLYFKGLFAHHQIVKTYAAVVLGKVEPPVGVIDKPIGMKAGTTRRTVHAGKMIKSARTNYRVERHKDTFIDTTGAPIANNLYGGGFSSVEVIPETGRTHQIRVHLASIGHPVVGDRMYGPKKEMLCQRLLLHAVSLEFSTPSGERLKLEAPLPKEFTYLT